MPQQTARALLADIGGTNARLALLRGEALSETERLKVAHFQGPAGAIRDFLNRHGSLPPPLIVLAVAGPVDAGRARLTNQSWTFDARTLASDCGSERVVLINDLEAQAWALPALRGDDLQPLGGGQAQAGAPRVALGAGTGTGVAAYLPASDSAPPRVIPGEGGHAALAAESDADAALLARLRARHGRVSAERVLSGPGLHGLGCLLAEEAGASEPASAEELVTRARAGEAFARKSLDAFCGFLGSFAGDLALIYGAHGGVFLTGGLSPGLAPELAASGFRARFEAKGRFRDYLARIPVNIVRRDEPALLGVANLAARLTA